MNDVNKVKAYNDIKSYLTDVQRSELLRWLGLDLANLPPRLRGFNVESEFFTILHFLQSCKHMISFDEAAPILTQSYTPDCCLVLKNEEKIFVEIKSTDKPIYEISGGNLQKKIGFAKEFGFELFFAIKHDNGLWGLYSSDYLQSKNRKLSYQEDYSYSKFKKMFGSQLIHIPKGIKIESYYSLDKKPLAGIAHPFFGNLFLYKFYFQDLLILEVKEENEIDAHYSQILEALQDAMSNQFQMEEKIDEKTIIVTEKLLEDTFFDDYVFLLSSINHLLNNSNCMFDPTDFYKLLIEKRGDTSFGRDHVYAAIQFMQKNGVPITIWAADNKCHTISDLID